MVVGGSQQETADPGFVLLGTRQQGVPVILRELVLPGAFDLVSPSSTVSDITTELSEPMVVAGSEPENLDRGFVLLGTCEQYVLMFFGEPMLPDGFNPISPSFIIRDVTTFCKSRVSC
ncbi:unnamed protein product [Schistosoma margrebowiei]|uniref:Uncharacterized protein n=1 Tax=Schistosoma margrebowiei TaxID=48269 RepID=A0A183LBQ3_9TREM|nr:unnamed protein product [Schistosoma margrebowiei]